MNNINLQTQQQSQDTPLQPNIIQPTDLDKSKEKETDKDKNKDVKTDSQKDKDKDKESLNVVVVEPNNNKITFKIKFTTKLGKLMQAYAKKRGGDYQSYRFTFDGERIDEEKTPKDIGVEDGDSIDVMIPQTGGSVCKKRKLF
jgi:small ubiquitin-related modifier